MPGRTATGLRLQIATLRSVCPARGTYRGSIQGGLGEHWVAGLWPVAVDLPGVERLNQLTLSSIPQGVAAILIALVLIRVSLWLTQGRRGFLVGDR